jgi:aspartyl-tRNA(Asn)/glutamyl-tRNA(Gln) amidotransferase subunit C
MITKDEIRKIANLAHLEISEAEIELYTGQIAEIVNYVEQLNELDTSSVDPALGGLTKEGAATDTSREDTVRPSLGQEAALAEAPDALAGHFRVPKVLG